MPCAWRHAHLRRPNSGVLGAFRRVGRRGFAGRGVSTGSIPVARGAGQGVPRHGARAARCARACGAPSVRLLRVRVCPACSCVPCRWVAGSDVTQVRCPAALSLSLTAPPLVAPPFPLCHPLVSLACRRCARPGCRCSFVCVRAPVFVCSLPCPCLLVPLCLRLCARVCVWSYVCAVTRRASSSGASSSRASSSKRASS